MSDPNLPALGQVPLPPDRSGRSGGSPTRPGIGCMVLPVLALVAVAIGGYFFFTSDDDSPKEPTSDEAAVAAPAVPVLAWTDAMEARDFVAACAVMTKDAIAQIAIGGTTCDGELGRLAGGGQYDGASTTRILDVVSKGDRAQVTVKLGGSPLPEQTMISLKEDGTWKVAPFDGTLAPPSPTTVPSNTDGDLTAACLAEKQSVEAALEAFSTEHGTYPTDIRALVVGGYLPSVPPNSMLRRDDGIVYMINACE